MTTNKMFRVMKRVDCIEQHHFPKLQRLMINAIGHRMDSSARSVVVGGRGYLQN